MNINVSYPSTSLYFQHSAIKPSKFSCQKLVNSRGCKSRLELSGTDRLSYLASLFSYRRLFYNFVVCCSEFTNTVVIKYVFPGV